MPISAVLSRPEFLEWLGRPKPAWDMTLRYDNVALPTRHIALVWLSEHPDEALEPIVAVPTAEMREFLAFTATYVNSYSPFTAYYRVVSAELLDGLPERSSRQPVDHLTALLGSAIVDAALNVGRPTQRVGDVNLQAVLASPISVAASAVSLGYDFLMISETLERWLWGKHVVAGDRPPSDISVMSFARRATAVLLGQTRPLLQPEDAAIAEMVGPLSPSGRGSTTLDQRLSSAAGSDFNVGRALKNSREERIKALDTLASILRNSPFPGDQRDLMLGYACAQVAEGSFGYLGLAAKWTTEAFPTAGLWFGFFAGLHPDSDVLTAGGGLGRRAQRKLLFSPGRIPLLGADIGFEEFILIQQENKLDQLRTEIASLLQVEIFPGISARYRVRPDSQKRIVPAPSQIRTREIQEIQALALRLSQALNAFSKTESMDDAPEPDRPIASLFPFGSGSKKPSAAKARTRNKS